MQTHEIRICKLVRLLATILRVFEEDIVQERIEILRLSDSFIDQNRKPDIELISKVFNISYYEDKAIRYATRKSRIGSLVSGFRRCYKKDNASYWSFKRGD